jgi:hypothetical protein
MLDMPEKTLDLIAAMKAAVPFEVELTLPLLARAVQFSILGGEFDDGGEVERGAVAGILDVVGA